MLIFFHLGISRWSFNTDKSSWITGLLFCNTLTFWQGIVNLHKYPVWHDFSPY